MWGYGCTSSGQEPLALVVGALIATAGDESIPYQNDSHNAP